MANRWTPKSIFLSRLLIERIKLSAIVYDDARSVYVDRLAHFDIPEPAQATLRTWYTGGAITRNGVVQLVS